MKYANEILDLSMTPEKWAELDRLLSVNEYRAVVADYQRREWERLPHCKTLFGLCRNYDGGHCTSPHYCMARELICVGNKDKEDNQK